MKNLLLTLMLLPVLAFAHPNLHHTMQMVLLQSQNEIWVDVGEDVVAAANRVTSGGMVRLSAGTHTVTSGAFTNACTIKGADNLATTLTIENSTYSANLKIVGLTLQSLVVDISLVSQSNATMTIEDCLTSFRVQVWEDSLIMINSKITIGTTNSNQIKGYAYLHKSYQESGTHLRVMEDGELIIRNCNLYTPDGKNVVGEQNATILIVNSSLEAADHSCLNSTSETEVRLYNNTFLNDDPSDYTVFIHDSAKAYVHGNSFINMNGSVGLGADGGNAFKFTSADTLRIGGNNGGLAVYDTSETEGLCVLVFLAQNQFSGESLFPGDYAASRVLIREQVINSPKDTYRFTEELAINVDVSGLTGCRGGPGVLDHFISGTGADAAFYYADGRITALDGRFCVLDPSENEVWNTAAQQIDTSAAFVSTISGNGRFTVVSDVGEEAYFTILDGGGNADTVVVEGDAGLVFRWGNNSLIVDENNNVSVGNNLTVDGMVNYAECIQEDDDYEVAIPGITALVAGLTVTFKVNTANTDGATLEITSVGDLDVIAKMKDQVLATNDIKAGQIVTVVFDGSFWQMTSQISQ